MKRNSGESIDAYFRKSRRVTRCRPARGETSASTVRSNADESFKRAFVIISPRDPIHSALGYCFAAIAAVDNNRVAQAYELKKSLLSISSAVDDSNSVGAELVPGLYR